MKREQLFDNEGGRKCRKNIGHNNKLLDPSNKGVLLCGCSNLILSLDDSGHCPEYQISFWEGPPEKKAPSTETKTRQTQQKGQFFLEMASESKTHLGHPSNIDNSNNY
ncbi:MAG: hypothetical protein K9K65_17080 [Desulfarculaceae bacterium]|nr:hypothetical protein [Desulfarculaceae bacterium]MCF8065687.1 hypothetical protein [Desulfarculaceae bacterium]MCF8099556.1 hypothetical protein [Desulfarculaceae bacterium]MCF8124158.1 hypothetical protein [Desulfarculaceae bacterium]